MASEAVLLALIALPSSLLTAAAVFVTAWRTDRKTKSVANELESRRATAEDKAESARTTAAVQLKDNSQKLDQVHTLVNSRMSEALTRIDMLEDQLMRAGIDPSTLSKEDI